MKIRNRGDWEMGWRNRTFVEDQKGIALVIAILMLLILTLLGSASITTSTYETKLSGDKRGSTDAFYATDGGIQSVLSETDNFNLSARFVSVDAKALPEDLRDQSIDSKYASPSMPLPPGVGFVHPPEITIFHAQQVNAPKGSGFSAINFKYEHFIIDAVGTDQMDPGIGRSSSHIRQKVVTVKPTPQGGY